MLIAAFVSCYIGLTCTEIQPSDLAGASDCNIQRIDERTIKWSAQINFIGSAEFKEDSWVNLIADMQHPRLPYFPQAG